MNLPASLHLTLPSLVLIRRELIALLRGGRAFLLLSIFVAFVGMFAILEWPSLEEFDLQTAGYISRSLIQTLTMAFAVASVLFVPAVAATAIVSERERSTYDFLTLSLVRPLGIVWAKLVNVLGFFFLLFVALMPVFGLAFFLVGVDLWDILPALSIVAASAITCASIGLLCSSRARTTMRAVAMTYGAVLLYLSLPGIVFGLQRGVEFVITRSYYDPPDWIAAALFVSSPAVAFVMLLEDATSIVAPYSLETAVILHLAYQTLITAVSIFLAAHYVKRPVKSPKIELRKPIDDAGELDRRRKKFPYYIVDPMRRRKEIEDGRNPMMVRELRWGLLNNATLSIRVFYASFVVYFFAGIIATFEGSPEDYAGTWTITQVVITILAAPAMTANVMTKERELRNIDMLRMTLLTPREIVLGKLAAGIVSMVPLLTAATLASVVLLSLGISEYIQFAVGYGVLFVSAFVAVCIGLFASTHASRTATALAIGYAVSILFFGGIDAIGETIYPIEAPTPVDSWHAGLFPRNFPTVSPIIGYLESISSYTLRATGYDEGSVVVPYVGFGLLSSLITAFLLTAWSVYFFKRFRMQDR